jgi:hypothetical protein
MTIADRAVALAKHLTERLLPNVTPRDERRIAELALEQIREAVAAEREACALLADADAAEAIRARGEPVK